MSAPCTVCKRPYPTDEFIDKDGVCIVCRARERNIEALKTADKK